MPRSSRGRGARLYGPHGNGESFRVQCVAQPRLEFRLRRVPDQVRARRGLQLAQCLLIGAATGATGDVLLDLQRSAQIELVVHVGVDQPLRLGAIHDALPACSRRATAARSCRRARESRDITVPMGTRAMSAISLYESPSISRSTKTSRNSTGSASTASLRKRCCAERRTSTSGVSEVCPFEAGSL